MNERIPFNKPFIAGNELTYIQESVALGNIGGDGKFTQLCSRWLESRYGIPRVLMTPSCTAALEMAAMLCDLQPGDDVLLPSYTFVSTALAVVRCGARPRFVDIRPDTLNIDERLLELAWTPQTKAVFPVHYAGVACEMDPILDFARQRNLWVVEDAAQAIDASYRGRPLGSLGDLATYSFHETKNVICGEGGALCINRPELIARAEILRDKGTNRKAFFRGEVDKYTWVDIGSSYVPSEITCAFLYAQLECVEALSHQRQQLYQAYLELLRPLEEAGRLQLPSTADSAGHNHHLFYVLLPDEATRDRLLAELRAAGIQAVFHYVPLHSSPMGRKYGYQPADLPVTEALSKRLLRLPLFHQLQRPQQERIAATIAQVL